MTDPTLTVPPISIHGFELERLLGSGASGDVYLARQDLGSGPAAYRAIKILNIARLRSDLVGTRALAKEQLEVVEQVVADVRRRFAAEEHIGPTLCHPSFVQYFQGGSVDDTPYIVMEYVPGVSAYEYVRENVLSSRPFSRSIRAENALREIARIGHQLASGLAFAHAEGIVHRDIKPENIRVAVDPAGLRSARAKVFDLGIAKIPPEKLAHLPVTQTLTIQGFLGTPAYMAPEQRGMAETTDGRADVFALGQTLLFLMTDHVLERSALMEVPSSGRQSHGPRSGGASSVLTWLQEAFPLAAGEQPTGSLHDAIHAWASLLVRMIRPDRADRPAMKDVAAELQLIARSGEDEAASGTGRAFARAVYEWETERSLPSNDADLGRYLRWAVHEELTPSEEQFLHAYEQDVSRRRLRSQQEAEEARSKAERALRGARTNYRRARTWLFVSGGLALLAIALSARLFEKGKESAEHAHNATELKKELTTTLEAAKKKNEISDFVLKQIQDKIGDKSITGDKLREALEGVLKSSEEERKRATMTAADAQSKLEEKERLLRSSQEWQHKLKRELDTCETGRSQCEKDLESERSKHQSDLVNGEAALTDCQQKSRDALIVCKNETQGCQSDLEKSRKESLGCQSDLEKSRKEGQERKSDLESCQAKLNASRQPVLAQVTADTTKKVQPDNEASSAAQKALVPVATTGAPPPPPSAPQPTPAPSQ